MQHKMELNLSDILRYVPKFQGKTVVIFVSGAALELMDLNNFAQQIAILSSLSIRTVIVHGSRYQINLQATKSGIAFEEQGNYRITNLEILEIAILESEKLTYLIRQYLSNTFSTGLMLKTVSGPFFKAKPLGVIGGIDYQRSGQVEKIYSQRIQELLDLQYIPILSAIGFDAQGQAYNVRSVELASQVAVSLQASKLVLLLEDDYTNLSSSANALELAELEELIKQNQQKWPALRSERLRAGLMACANGVERAHFILGTEQDGLIREFFTQTGAGLLISGDSYRFVRSATIQDIPKIMEMMQNANQLGEFRLRQEEDFAKKIDDFFVFELEGKICGSIALHSFEKDGVAELAALVVEAKYRHLGVGKKLVEFIISRAKKQTLSTLYLSTTRATQFFKQFGFEETDIDEVHPMVSQNWIRERNAKIMRIAFSANGS